MLDCLQTVRTVTVCRVLVVPRSAYHSIKAAFPLGTRQMLDNLQAHAEAVSFSYQCKNIAWRKQKMLDNLRAHADAVSLFMLVQEHSLEEEEDAGQSPTSC